MYLACWVRIILLGKDSKRVIHIFNQRPKSSLIVFLLDNHVYRTCLWGPCFLLPGRCLITSRPEGWSTPRSVGDGRHCFLLRPANGCCSSNCRHWFVTCFYKWASAIYEKHFFFCNARSHALISHWLNAQQSCGAQKMYNVAQASFSLQRLLLNNYHMRTKLNLISYLQSSA